MKLFDVNVSIGHWPFQRFAFYQIEDLCSALHERGIKGAMVSPVEAILNSDPHYNQVLAEMCGEGTDLIPVPVVDASMPGWQQRVAEGSRAIKIIPNYHRYALHTEPVRDLMLFLQSRALPLIIQMRVDDERNQHPLMRVPGVATSEMLQLARLYPQQKILCLNAYIQEATELLQQSENIYIDISFCEHMDTLATLTANLPVDRLLFGSHTPFLYTRAAVMKVKGSRISEADKQKIAFKNAMQLFQIEELG